MKVLFDTNVIIDIWKKDPDFFLDSYAAYDICLLRGWEPYVAVTAVPDIEYLLMARGILPKRKAAEAMDALFKMFSIADAQECDCVLAQQSNLPDLEDGIIAYSALRNGMDTIVTRNMKDFVKSPVAALTPTDFVATYKPANVNYDRADWGETAGESSS